MQKSRVIVLDHFPAVEHKKKTETTRKHLQSMRERDANTHTQTRAHTQEERYTHNIYTHTKTQINPQGEIHTHRHTRTEPTHQELRKWKSDTPSPVPPFRGLCTDPDEHNSA